MRQGARGLLPDRRDPDLFRCRGIKTSVKSRHLSEALDKAHAVPNKEDCAVNLTNRCEGKQERQST